MYNFLKDLFFNEINEGVIIQHYMKYSHTMPDNTYRCFIDIHYKQPTLFYHEFKKLVYNKDYYIKNNNSFILRYIQNFSNIVVIQLYNVFIKSLNDPSGNSFDHISFEIDFIKL
jgi:hypothetical protein